MRAKGGSTSAGRWWHERAYDGPGEPGEEASADPDRLITQNVFPAEAGYQGDLEEP